MMPAVGDSKSLIRGVIIYLATGPNKVKAPVRCFQVVVLTEFKQQIRGRVALKNDSRGLSRNIVSFIFLMGVLLVLGLRIQ